MISYTITILERDNMRKHLNLILINCLLVFSIISHAAFSLVFINIESVNLSEPINDSDLSINAACYVNESGMYYSNDYLFLVKETGRDNETLEIYDVSNPLDMNLAKTFVYNWSSCHHQSLTRCLSGNDNYTFIHIQDLDYQRSLIVFDMKSPNLTHAKFVLPDSDYLVAQILVDNDYLYLVRDAYNWSLDWQIEKYKINNPLSLSLVSNVSVAKFSYLYAKDNNLFIYNDKDINNWINPYGSEYCNVVRLHYEDNKLFVLLDDHYGHANSFEGLLILNVTNNESYQVLASYSLAFVVDFVVVENNIFIATIQEVISLKHTNYSNIENLDSYSFEYIMGTINLMDNGNDLLFISKSFCSGRYFGTKDEDKVSFVILSVENPNKIIAVFPDWYDNSYNFFIDGGFFENTIFIPLVVIVSIAIVVATTVFIRRKIKNMKLQKT